MRKSLIMTGALAAVLAGSAYAQQPPSQQPPPPGGQNGGPPGIVVIGPAPQGQPGQPTSPQGSPMIMGGPAAGRAMQEQMMAQEAQGGPPGGLPHPMMMGHHPHGPEMDEAMMHMRPPKGAVFMFRDGDERMLIKCADEEPTKVCVDAATTLIDKINGDQGQQSQGQQANPNQ